MNNILTKDEREVLFRAISIVLDIFVFTDFEKELLESARRKLRMELLGF